MAETGHAVNVSNFAKMISCCESSSEAIAADYSHFSLDAKQWKSTVAALDGPRRNIEALRRLLTEPGVFDVE